MNNNPNFSNSNIEDNFQNNKYPNPQVVCIRNKRSLTKNGLPIKDAEELLYLDMNYDSRETQFIRRRTR